MVQTFFLLLFYVSLRFMGNFRAGLEEMVSLLFIVSLCFIFLGDESDGQYLGVLEENFGPDF